MKLPDLDALTEGLDEDGNAESQTPNLAAPLNDPFWPADLTEPHREYLAVRAVHPKVASSRGYFTATTRNQVIDRGFGRTSLAAKKVNGQDGKHALMIPLCQAGASEPVCWQMRLDDPRTKTEKGKTKTLKFEVPNSVKRGLGDGKLPADVHPAMHDRALESDMQMIWTEGIVKGDALLSAALTEQIDIVPVSFTGVTMAYVATDQPDGSKTYSLSPALADMPLNDRIIYLAFDADYRDNPMVVAALHRTIEMLEAAGAHPRVLDIPPVNGDNKAGVDDYLAFGGTLAELLTYVIDPPEMPSNNSAAQVKDTFTVDVNHLELFDWDTKKDDDPVKVKMLDAVPTIAEQVSVQMIVDHELKPLKEQLVVKLSWQEADGVEQSSQMEIDAEEFPNVAKWLPKMPGGAMRYRATVPHWDGKVANTIVDESRIVGITEAVVTEATGWYLRSTDPGRDMWSFLHAGGGVTASDRLSTEIATESEDNSVRHTVLPFVARKDRAKVIHKFLWDWVDPAQVNAGYDTINESAKTGGHPPANRDVFDVASLLGFGAALISRAVLPGKPLRGITYAEGGPGSGKTLTAATWTSAFGDHFADEAFTNFSSTAAGIEAQLAPARNILVNVDDFHPSSEKDNERMVAVIDNLARSAHDGAKKHRSTATLSSMKVGQSAATIVATGETRPSSTEASNSALERMLFLNTGSKMTDVAGKDAYGLLANRVKTAAGRAAQQRFVSAVLGLLVEHLDALTAEVVDEQEDVSPRRVINEVLTRLKDSTTANVDTLLEQVVWEAQQRNDDNPNARTLEIIKDLLAGWSLVSRLCVDAKIITDVESVELSDHVCTAVGSVLAQTMRVVADTDPARRVFVALRSAVSGGRAHFAMQDGGCPTGDGVASSWGWRRGAGDRIEPSRSLIGWYVPATKNRKAHMALDTHLLLAAFKDSRSSLAVLRDNNITEALGKFKADDGRILLADRGSGTAWKVERTINGARRNVLALDLDVLGLKDPEKQSTSSSADGVTPLRNGDS